MKTRTILLIALLAVLVLATIVWAAGPKGPRAGATTPPPGAACPMGGPGCGMFGFGNDLGLTDQQKADLKKISEDCMAACKPIKEELATKAAQMKDLWLQPQPDASAIKALAHEIDAIHAQMRDNCIDRAVRAFGVLDANQQAKVRERMKNAPGPGFGMGPCCGMGPGAGMGPGCGMGPGAGMGMGAGMGKRDGTGPRAGMGTCPMMNK